MANEKRLIDANALKQHLLLCGLQLNASTLGFVNKRVDEQPTVDAVSKGLFDQIKLERYIAIEQLADYGISLGEKADVTKVVHGRWESNRWKYVCSCCQTPFTDELPWITHPDCRMPNYCPNCGADMRERKDNG